MWTLRVFVGGWLPQIRSEKIEDGLAKLQRMGGERFVGPLTHCPATKTIHHNGQPIGCYYDEQIPEVEALVTKVEQMKMRLDAFTLVGFL